MRAGDYDLAGFCVGIAEKDALLTPERVKPGDALIGLASSGPHSNGYSLIRKIIEVSGADLDQSLDGSTLAERLLAPTRIYVKPVLGMMREVDVHAMAHITGGACPRTFLGCCPRRRGRSSISALGDDRPCSTGCRHRVVSRKRRCCAPSTAVSAW